MTPKCLQNSEILSQSTTCQFFSEFKWEDSNDSTTILTNLRKSEKGKYFAIAISQTLD